MGNSQSSSLSTCESFLIKRVQEICSSFASEKPFKVYSKYNFFGSHLESIFLSGILRIYGRGCIYGVLKIDLTNDDSSNPLDYKWKTIDQNSYCKKDSEYHVWIVTIMFQGKKIGHANALWINPKKKMIEHFEPHGSITKHFDLVTKAIKSFSSKEYPDYKNVDSNLVCPRIGVQAIAKDSFCQNWSMIYIYFKMSCYTDEEDSTTSIQKMFASFDQQLLIAFMKEWSCFQWSFLERLGIVECIVARVCLLYIWTSFLKTSSLSQEYKNNFAKKQAEKEINYDLAIANFDLGLLQWCKIETNKLIKDIMKKWLSTWDYHVRVYNDRFIIKLPISPRNSTRFTGLEFSKEEWKPNLVSFQAFYNSKEGDFANTWIPFNGIRLEKNRLRESEEDPRFNEIWEQPYEMFSKKLQEIRFPKLPENPFRPIKFSLHPSDPPFNDEFVSLFGSWDFMKLSSFFADTTSKFWNSETGLKILNSQCLNQLGYYMKKSQKLIQMDSEEMNLEELNNWISDANIYGRSMNDYNKSYF